MGSNRGGLQFYTEKLNSIIYTDVINTQVESDLKIYPNAATNRLSIFSSKRISKIELYDHAGRLLMIDATPNQAGQLLQLNLHQYYTGL